MKEKKNNYYIEPELLKWRNKPVKEQFLKSIKSGPIAFYIIFFIISFLITSFAPTVGWSSFAFFLTIAVLGYMRLWRKTKKKLEHDEQTVTSRNQELKKKAGKVCANLLSTRKKSLELSNKGVPAQIKKANNTLEKIKLDFSENALIPFWDEVEKFVVEMDSLDESIRILSNNRNNYYEILHDTVNNLPTDYPVSSHKEEIELMITEFKAIQREAFKKFEFANLWEQRKTQKILAFGFSNLQMAIDNMSNNIVSSINTLNNSINNMNDNMVRGLSDISNDIQSIKMNNVHSISQTNRILKDNLKSIDQKLYNIQHDIEPLH